MASSKKDKLGKLKQAARNHLDETIGGERPKSDMTDFMESMPGSGQVPGEKQPPTDADHPNESSAPTPPDAPVVPEETLVEVDTDQSVNLSPSPSASAPPDASADLKQEPSSEPQSPEDSAQGSPPEIELPNGGQTAAYAGKAAGRPERSKSMPKTRDSIYNVSSDIRLEDYTEGNGGSGGGRMGTIAKIGGVIVLLALLGWGGQQLMLWLDAPTYRVTVANELIDETNAASLAEVQALVLSSSAPVHIRFDWEEGDLATDFLRIEILRAAGGQVEAAQERRPPLTANYVYFMGPLDPGSYQIRVLDRDKAVLVQRDFRVN